jgi:hypothetical protein
MIKIILYLLTIAVASVVLIGCGGGDKAFPQPCTPQAGTGGFTVDGKVFDFYDMDRLPDGSFRLINFDSQCNRIPVVIGVEGQIIRADASGKNYRIGKDNYMTLVTP